MSHGTIHTVHTTYTAAFRTTTHPKTRCRKPYAATQHLMLLMMGYVPETCRAKNTLIKLPCCIKLAFQIISVPSTFRTKKSDHSNSSLRTLPTDCVDEYSSCIRLLLKIQCIDNRWPYNTGVCKCFFIVLTYSAVSCMEGYRNRAGAAERMRYTAGSVRFSADSAPSV